MSQPKRRIPLAMAMLHGANPGLAKDQEIARLRAEVERLRKAGDAMHLAHEANFKVHPYTQNQVEKAMKAWLAAKGVQS